MEAKSSSQSGNPHDALLPPEQFVFLPSEVDDAWTMGLSTNQKVPKSIDKLRGFLHLSLSLNGGAPLASITIRTALAKVMKNEARRNCEFIDITTSQFLIMD